MLIRPLTSEDAFQHETVASSAFVYSFSPEKPQFLPNGTFYGAFQDDNKTLMSEVQNEDFICKYFDSQLKCAAVSGVAAKPEYRRSGSVRAIFEEMFRILPGQGYDISVLFPFSESYYQKFGYENIGYYQSAEMPFSVLSHIPRFSEVTLYNGTQFDELLTAHRSNISHYDFSFFRTDNRYFNASPYETCRSTYFLSNPDKNGRGFVSFYVNREKSTVYVQEIGFESYLSLISLLGFLRVYDGNFDTLVFENLPMLSPLFSVITELHLIKREIKPIGAARIFNLKKVMEAGVYPKEKGSFTFHNTDTVSENNGCFLFAYQNGKGKLTKITDTVCDLELNPLSLAKMLLGGISGGFEALSYEKSFVINRNNECILKAFPQRTVFFTERF